MVEAVFIAESFTTLMEQALRYDGNAFDVLRLLGFRAPEILDIALALGLLIALHFTVSDARRRGELIILATAGVRWTQVIWFALTLGACGTALSLLTAGHVVPAARYGERIAVAELQARHVVDQILRPGPRSTIQTFGGTTFIATDPLTDGQERGQLFVFTPRSGGPWRASLSQDWTITGPDEDGAHDIRLSTFRAYEANPEQASPINVISARNAAFSFRLDDLVPEPDRRLEPGETPIRLRAIAPDDRRRAGEMLARAVLVPAAALWALVAVVAGGGGPGRIVALPLAAALVLGYDVAGRALVGEAATLLPALPVVLLCVLAYILPPLTWLLARGEAIMTPPRGS